MSEKIEKLENDILNIPYHVFGDHSKCASYFAEKCNRKEDNHMTELQFDKSLMSDKIRELFSSIATKSDSLIHDVDSNYPEQFHSIVAKFVGGKRINFSLGKSYETRTLAAIIQFNTNCIHSTIQEFIFHSSSNPYITKLENNRVAKNARNTEKRKSNKENKKKTKFYSQDQHLFIYLYNQLGIRPY